MNKILVTGSSGFVGKNLCNLLTEKGFIVLPVTRDTTLKQLEHMASTANYCFHLAGEVRPDATNDSFLSSNTEFTQNLINILAKNPIDIVFTSTVHAENASNCYGMTKKSAEDVVKSYGVNNAVNTHVFRLPHLFGPLCKPNYNSVITTWIYNALNNKELIVFDEEHELTYLFVTDLVELFFEQVSSTQTLGLPAHYKIKLGNLKEAVLRIVNNGKAFSTIEFEQKLETTINHYKI